MVSPKVFKDDPLRLLRAFTLQATLGFKMDAQTRRQIKKDAHLISTVAAERIREEIFKILASPRAYETLSSMDKIGLLPQVIPQITVMYGVAPGRLSSFGCVAAFFGSAFRNWKRSLNEMSRQ